MMNRAVLTAQPWIVVLLTHLYAARLISVVDFLLICLGHTCGEALEMLKNWHMRMQVKDALDITEQGLEDMYYIGRWHCHSFPTNISLKLKHV